MPAVGTAYVNVRVNTSGFESSLDKMLARLSTSMEREGEKLGKSFERGFKNSTKDTFKPLEDGAKNASTTVKRELDEIGKSATKMGSEVTSGSRAAATGMRGLERATEDISEGLHDIDVEARNVDRSLSRAGGSAGAAGGGFRRGGDGAGFFASRVREFNNEIPKNLALLQRLHNMEAFVGTAAAGIVGGLAAAAQGIFAIGANAAAAAPALAVLANGLVGLAQVGGTVGIAMQGVGDAITAGISSSDKAAVAVGSSMGGMSSATASASRAVRDAKQSLQDAYRDSARAAADANRRVVEAEEALAEAQMESLTAQKALNAARKEGREEMEDIAFAAEDAALAERRAGLDLADATVALQAVSGLAPDDRMRVEAQLAFEEADLQARQATDAREDADKAQKESVQKGLQGTEAMVQAHNDVADAAEREADAEQALADARMQAARSAQDGARRIADAQQGIADAQQRLTEAQKSSAAGSTAAQTALDQYNLALSKLGPQQQEFVKSIVGLQDAWQRARQIIAEPMFKGVNEALDTLLKGDLLGEVGKRLTGTSRNIGEFVESSAELAESESFQGPFIRVLTSNNQNMDLWGGTLQNLAVAFINVADAARPLFRRFSEWTNAVTDNWRETAEADNKSGKLTDTLYRAGKRVSDFFGLIKELWRWLGLVGGAADKASNRFGELDDAGKPKGYIVTLTENLGKFNDALDKPGKKKKMIDDFTQSLETLNAAGGAFKDAIIDPLLTLSANEGLEDAFKAISDHEDSFQRIADASGDAVPHLGELVGDIADLLADLSESGSIDHFLDWLEKAASAMGTLTGWLNDTGALKWIGYITAAAAMYKVLWGTTKLIGSPFVAMARGATNLIKTVGRVATGFKEGGLKGAAKGFKKDPKDSAKAAGAGEDVSEAYARGLRAGLPKIEAAMEALEAKVKLGFKEMSTTLTIQATKTGQDIMEGLEAGIRTGAIEAKAAALKAGRDVATDIGTGAGTHSPSTITLKDGNDIMEGLELGIKAGTAEAKLAATTAGASVGNSVGNSAKAAAATSTAGMGPAMSASATSSMGKSSGRMAGAMGKMMKPLSAVARGMGGLMTLAMGPFGIAIELIILLLPILIPLFKKLEEKTGIFSKTLDLLTTALGWVWDKIKTVFNWIKDNWPTLLAIITGPIGLAVLLITKNWDTIKAVVQAAVDFVTDILSKIWDGITAGWDVIATFFSTLWSDKLQPIFQGIIDKARALLNKIWNGIKEGWNAIGEWIRNLWKDRLQPILTNLITNARNKLVNFFKGIIQGYAAIGIWLANLWTDKVKPKIDSLLESATNKLKTFFDGIKEGWQAIKGWFDGLWDSISGKIATFATNFSAGVSAIWDGLKDGFEDVYEAVAKAVNDHLIGGINKVLKFVGAPEINISMDEDIALAEGGPVVGRGGGKDDKVRARLSHGEYVMPAKAARGIGRPALDVMRKTGRLPMGDPGPFGWVWNKAKDFGSALTNGTEFAIKWAIEQLLNNLPDNFIGDMIKGVIENAADAFADWGKSKEPVPAGYGGDVIVPDPDNPASHMTWQGHVFSNLFYAHMKKALSLAGLSSVTIFQGGFRPTTDYSGTSHAGDAIDTIVNYAWLYALRRVGIASGDRTGLGDWAPHIHAIPGPGAGYAGGSAVWQWSDYMARGGAKQSAKSPWGLGMGGIIGAVPGGTLAVIAEAGKSERVTPLDAEGFTPAERRIVAMLEKKMASTGDTYHVHPSQQMDEAALADMVARRVAWKRRRGGGSR